MPQTQDLPTQTFHRLPDQLRPNLRLVLVGTAASARSAELGHYYAHPGNRFWRAIHEAGITPRRYQPGEFASLIELGIGFTDLSKSAPGWIIRSRPRRLTCRGSGRRWKSIGRGRLRSRARRRRACFMEGRRERLRWGGRCARKAGRRYSCCRRRLVLRPGIGRSSHGGSWRSGLLARARRLSLGLALLSCPGQAQRRPGTQKLRHGCGMGPGSAAHHAASGALHCVRGTPSSSPHPAYALSRSAITIFRIPIIACMTRFALARSGSPR